MCYLIRTQPLLYIRKDIGDPRKWRSTERITHHNKVRRCAWLCVGDWCCLPSLCGNQTCLHEEHTAPAKVTPHSWPSPWLLPTCVKEQKVSFFFLGGFNSLSRRITQFSVFSEGYTRKKETELVVDWWLMVRQANNTVPLLFYSDSIFFSNHEWPIVLKEINVFLFSAFMFYLLAVKDGGGERADLTRLYKEMESF